MAAPAPPAPAPAIAAPGDPIFGPTGFFGNDKDANLEKLVASIIGYTKYKIEKLEKATSSNTGRVDLIVRGKEDFKRSIKTLVPPTSPIIDQAVEAIKEKGKDIAESIKGLVDESARTTVIINLLKETSAKFCNNANKAANKAELEKNIREAITELREKVTGETGEVRNIRAKIENYLIEFTNSWESFKESYRMNICMTGGAGVGKTTLARAASKCFNAFGILATNTVIEPERRDLIAQYVGQTAHRTLEKLYEGLEGVVFIDEAYAVAGRAASSHDYGQEFIDQLVLFTQKFPGHLSIIVAGYKKEMDEMFFKRNEGLTRRFPIQFELMPYPVEVFTGALAKNVTKKLGLPEDQLAAVKAKLQYHEMLIKLIYLDTSDESADASFDKHMLSAHPQFFDFFAFNLEPLIRIFYLTDNIQKRNVLKGYILKYKFGINQSDLFPNQMGDMQNIVDIILSQPAIMNHSPIRFEDGKQAMNNYFKMRDPHHFYVTAVPTPSVAGAGPPTAAEEAAIAASRKYVIHFCPHNQAPAEFQTNVLDPLFKPLLTKIAPDANLGNIVGVERADFFGEISNEEYIKQITKHINSLYTDAIRKYYQEFSRSESGETGFKPPSNVRYAFVKQQMEHLEYEARSRAQKEGNVVGAEILLDYFESSSGGPEDIPVEALPPLDPLAREREMTADELCGRGPAGPAAAAAGPGAPPPAPSAAPGFPRAPNAANLPPPPFSAPAGPPAIDAQIDDFVKELQAKSSIEFRRTGSGTFEQFAIIGKFGNFIYGIDYDDDFKKADIFLTPYENPVGEAFVRGVSAASKNIILPTGDKLSTISGGAGTSSQLTTTLAYRPDPGYIRTIPNSFFQAIPSSLTPDRPLEVAYRMFEGNERDSTIRKYILKSLVKPDENVLNVAMATAMVPPPAPPAEETSPPSSPRSSVYLNNSNEINEEVLNALQRFNNAMVDNEEHFHIKKTNLENPYFEYNGAKLMFFLNKRGQMVLTEYEDEESLSSNAETVLHQFDKYFDNEEIYTFETSTLGTVYLIQPWSLAASKDLFESYDPESISAKSPQADLNKFLENAFPFNNTVTYDASRDLILKWKLKRKVAMVTNEPAAASSAAAAAAAPAPPPPPPPATVEPKPPGSIATGNSSATVAPKPPAPAPSAAPSTSATPPPILQEFLTEWAKSSIEIINIEHSEDTPNFLLNANLGTFGKFTYKYEKTGFEITSIDRDNAKLQLLVDYLLSSGTKIKLPNGVIITPVRENGTIVLSAANLTATKINEISEEVSFPGIEGNVFYRKRIDIEKTPGRPFETFYSFRFGVKDLIIIQYALKLKVKGGARKPAAGKYTIKKRKSDGRTRRVVRRI